LKKFFSFFFGAILGGAIGASAALLFAPMKGTELRQKLNEYLIEVKSEVGSAVEERKSELQDQITRLRKPAASK
jgi:gas vesicle protein